MKFISELQRGDVFSPEQGLKVVVKDVRKVGIFYRVKAFSHHDVWYFKNGLVETEQLTFTVESD
jgi:hypothetical protein